jgi:hypothetical protein
MGIGPRIPSHKLFACRTFMCSVGAHEQESRPTESVQRRVKYSTAHVQCRTRKQALFLANLDSESSVVYTV